MYELGYHPGNYGQVKEGPHAGLYGKVREREGDIHNV